MNRSFDSVLNFIAKVPIFNHKSEFTFRVLSQTSFLNSCVFPPWLLHGVYPLWSLYNRVNKFGDPWIGDPWIVDPGVLEPRIVDPWIGEPRVGDPGVLEPRVGDPGVGELRSEDPRVGDPGVLEPRVGDPGVGELRSEGPRVGELRVGVLKVKENQVQGSVRNRQKRGKNWGNGEELYLDRMDGSQKGGKDPFQNGSLTPNAFFNEHGFSLKSNAKMDLSLQNDYLLLNNIARKVEHQILKPKKEKDALKLIEHQFYALKTMISELSAKVQRKEEHLEHFINNLWLSAPLKEPYNEF